MKELGKNIALSLGLEMFRSGFNIIRSINRSTITVNERDDGFLKVNKILYNLDPVKYSKFRVPITNMEIFQLSPEANYIIRLNSNTFLHVMSCREDKAQTQIKKLILNFYGKDKFKYREKFFKYVAKRTSKKYIEIIPMDLRGDYISNKVLSISFDDIILKKDITNKIVNGLYNWKNDKQWYYDNKMIHKIGVLLYGPPGTGKSTVVKCISNMFGNANILTIVNGLNIKTMSMEIIRHRKSISPKETLIVLIEDFDMFFNNREDMSNNYPDKNIRDENMNVLFQMLDGVYSTQNTIYIATTNYIDKIDPALIRYGRFDIQVELGYFSKQDSIDYIRKLCMDESILDSLNLKFPVQPSLLRNSILEYRAQKYINGGN